VFLQFCDACAQIPDCRVLELGARDVGGISRRANFSHAKQYVGFDLHPGPGVDLVGDVHQLSQYFPGAAFDAVFSMSVFEHLAFPWKVVLETNRVLRVGGICYVLTHPVWPRHELPWDFWRFPPAGLEVLFSAATGFRLITIEQGLPAKLHSLVDDRPTRGVSDDYVYLGVGLIAEKISEYDSDKLRWDVPLASVLNTTYPSGKPVVP
jgi:SAM-dependent methyltransferase